MSEHRIQLNPELGERELQTLKHALLTREDQVVRRLIGDTSKCLELSRQRVLATGAEPSAGEMDHLSECRRCRVRLQALRSQLEVAAKKAEAAEADVEGSMQSRRMNDVCGAIRTVANHATWRTCDFDQAWPIVSDMIDAAMDAADRGADVYPRSAAMYADVLVRTPDTIKVMLVYGLTHLLESGAAATALAMQIAKEIAEGNDEVAHRVLAMTIHTEGAALAGLISSDRRMEISSRTQDELAPYLRQINVEKRVFDNVLTPVTPREAIVDIVNESILPMADKMFDRSNDPVRRVLHLLSIRAYFAHVTQRVQEHRGELANSAFSLIAKAITDRRSVHGASLALALEACDKLSKLPWVWPVIAKPLCTLEIRVKEVAG